MSVVREGNHDRAWNDPPQFGYTAGGNGPAGRQRTQLNKRVAYLPTGMTTESSSSSPPVQSATAVSESVSAPVPIPFPGVVPLDQSGSIPSPNINVFTPPDFHRPNATPPCGSPPNLLDGKVDISKVPNIDSAKMMSEVDANINEMLNRIQPSVSGRKLEDIKRRLDVMRNQWKDGHISETTQKRMYLLAQSISDCDFDEAARLQVSLIRDSSCEVAQWIVGVKHVILECQAQNIHK